MNSSPSSHYSASRAIATPRATTLSIEEVGKEW